MFVFVVVFVADPLFAYTHIDGRAVQNFLADFSG